MTAPPGRRGPDSFRDDDNAVIGRVLRALPDVPLPPSALEAIWAGTIRARDRAHHPADPGRRTALAQVGVPFAAAAALVLTSVGAWTLGGSRAPTEAELARLDREVMLALSVLGRALRRAERIAVSEVLVGETGPAVRSTLGEVDP